MKNLVTKREYRLRRHRRVRGKVHGTEATPRLLVFRSNQHVYASLINDENGTTLASCSDRKLSKAGKKKPLEQAKEIGTMIAEQAKAKKIAKVVFDRGGYKYHGIVKAVAEAAREGGLKF